MTVPLFPQGVDVDHPVPLPAEDARIELGGLLTPSATSTDLSPKSGIFPARAGYRGEVTAAAGGVLTVNPFIAVMPGTVNGQGSYVAALRSPKVLDPADVGGLPGAGQFRIGLVLAKVDDPVYDASGALLLNVSLVLGAPAATAGAAIAPATPAGARVLKTVTFDSAGATALTGTPSLTVAAGGIRPVIVGVDDGLLPDYDGQPRWHPTDGPQYGQGGAWKPPTHGLPRFLGYMTATSGPVAVNTWAQIPLQAEAFDSHNGHAGAAVFYTIPPGQGGLWEISGQIAVTGFTAGNRFNAAVFKNAAILPAYGHAGYANVVNATGFTMPVPLRAIEVNAGDTISIAGRAAVAWQAHVDAAVDMVTSFMYARRVA